MPSHTTHDLDVRLLLLMRSSSCRMLKDFPNVARWNQSEDLFQSSVIRLQAAKEEVQPKLTRRLENLGSLQVRRTLIDLACSDVSSADLGPDDWTPAVSDCCAGEVPAKFLRRPRPKIRLSMNYLIAPNFMRRSSTFWKNSVKCSS